MLPGNELSQMPIGERDTGPGFQVALESGGATLVGEFNHDINRPRPMLRGVGAAACIVLGVSGCHVAGEASVVSWWDLGVLEQVHETLQHKRASSNLLAVPIDAIHPELF